MIGAFRNLRGVALASMKAPPKRKGNFIMAATSRHGKKPQ